MSIKVKDLTSSLVVSKEVAEFLNNKSFKTSREKVSVFAALYESERSEEHPLVISDEEYDDVLKAVMTGDYIVDTGRYFVNIGFPIGKEEFLSQTGVSVKDDGSSSINFDLEMFMNAKAFTLEELETVLPQAYRSPDYIMLEEEARRRYESY